MLGRSLEYDGIPLGPVTECPDCHKLACPDCMHEADCCFDADCENYTDSFCGRFGWFKICGGPWKRIRFGFKYPDPDAE